METRVLLGRRVRRPQSDRDIIVDISSSSSDSNNNCYEYVKSISGAADSFRACADQQNRELMRLRNRLRNWHPRRGGLSICGERMLPSGVRFMGSSLHRRT